MMSVIIIVNLIFASLDDSPAAKYAMFARIYRTVTTAREIKPFFRICLIGFFTSLTTLKAFVYPEYANMTLYNALVTEMLLN